MRRPGTKPVGAVLVAALVGSLAVAAAAYGTASRDDGADRSGSSAGG